MSSSQNSVEQHHLIPRYEGLPPQQQKIVQVLSVIYEPVTGPQLVAVLEAVDSGFFPKGVAEVWPRRTPARSKGRNGRGFGPPPPASGGVNPDLSRRMALFNTLDKPIQDLLRLQLISRDRMSTLMCHPLIAETATRDLLRQGKFDGVVAAANQHVPASKVRSGDRYFTGPSQLLRAARIALYSNDIPDFLLIFEEFSRYSSYYYGSPISPLHAILAVFNTPFDPDFLLGDDPDYVWVPHWSDDLVSMVLSNLLLFNLIRTNPDPEPFEALEAMILQRPQHLVLQLVLVDQSLLRGKLEQAKGAIAQIWDLGAADAPVNRVKREAWQLALEGRYADALPRFALALKQERKLLGKRQGYLLGVEGLFLIFALIADGRVERLKEASVYLTQAEKSADGWISPAYSALRVVVEVQQGNLTNKGILSRPIELENASSINVLVRCLCLYWIDRDQAKSRLSEALEDLYEETLEAGYTWLALEYATLMARLEPKNKRRQKLAEDLKTKTGIQSVVDILQPQEAWEMSLNALKTLTKPPVAEASPTESQRLAWFVTYYIGGCNIQPKEQKVNAKGVWSAGRNIALKRLKQEASSLDYLLPQDHATLNHLKQRYQNWGASEYIWEEKAILGLVGHPYVYWEDSPTTRLDIIKGQPEVLVKQAKGDRLMLSFSPRPTSTGFDVVKETPTRLKIVEFTPDHLRIASLLGQGLEVPASAKDQVLEAIGVMAGLVTVHSDIGGGSSSAEQVEAQSEPHIHLLPAGEGLKVAVLSCPFGAGGPYFQPGEGGLTVFAEIEGKALQTTRSLKQEEALARAAVNDCPTLADRTLERGECVVEEPDECLDLLLELQGLGDRIVLEWPEGQKLRVTNRLSELDMKLSVNQQKDWFSIDGELQVDSELVLSMQQLMGLLEDSPGRFLKLQDGQFLALTDEFRRRLSELRNFTESYGKGLRAHPLAALGLEELLSEAGQVEVDKHWRAHIQKLRDLDKLNPQLPSTLQADLRDYQQDGFQWLARLAHWGVGACLADDMGLGKTLQALALILARAPEGPTLVLAPTSVGMNWSSEAARFAPTLNVLTFGSGDRQNMLDELKPLDLVICTYGLLQQEETSEMLAKVEWQTIVLDEAQAIKNFATKRSQAAMQLQAGFKIITTGTPIENHLGELWNLFRFINPGLLGSWEKFNARFATPIERYQDNRARDGLKKLIQPFILRRTKNQVLKELPSRTEITLQVELSREERAFYEALRREAMDKLANTDLSGGAQHLKVLAEIMRLRRACCNPDLVQPQLNLPSAKLQLFEEVLAELLDNGHKALVFSQFVDHLSILRQHLDSKGIAYQYLDGSTPVKARKQRVMAFQAGEGDVFLISLKAGGTGLNLTAADYVIHMDPWWNPAVEDQASDRAHRIGQQRPVTIYRLVAKSTIEEKIVQLHHQKRDLADSLLEGSEMSGKISTADLLQLIQAG
jgi:superfamily II DNA or RNA helicase